MNTTTSLQDFPADIRDNVAQFATLFFATIENAEDITAERVGNELHRLFTTVPGWGYDGNHEAEKIVKYAVKRLAGTYDEFRAEAAA